MRWSSSVVLALAASCVLSQTSTEPSEAGSGFERAPSPSPRLDHGRVEAAQDLSDRIDGYFQRFGTRRLHVQLDRPLYKPGDSVWIKSWNLKTASLSGEGGLITYELVNPRGQVVGTKRVAQAGGTATNDFVLDASAPGGRWTLRATANGETDERPFIVSNVQAPTIRKKMEFVREAYGAGDTLEALVELEHNTAGPLANRDVRMLLQIDGQTVSEQTLTTNDEGAVLASAKLPGQLQTGDGMLTILVDDGGITESISRSVPIVLADANLAFFPEGGDLVTGLPGRVYLESTNRHGEPADVEGYIADDTGRKVGSFRTVHDGLGRFSFTPNSGRSYTAHVTSPAGIDGAFPLPAAKDGGCTVRSFDDFESSDQRVRVGVRCSSDREVVVTGVLREQTLDTAAVRVRRNRDAVVYLSPTEALSDQQGAVRVTVFDDKLNPLAERLIYRNHGKNLKIDMTTDQLTYGPRDEVIVDITTTDPSGDPVAAEVALSVVNDGVISFADDKNGHMLTRLYLEPELVDSPKDPSFYFDNEEALAAQGMDLVMGTKGYRRFEWAPVWNPPMPMPTSTASYNYTRGGALDMPEDDGVVMGAAPPAEIGFAKGLQRQPVPRPMAQAAPEPELEPSLDAIAEFDERPPPPPAGPVAGLRLKEDRKVRRENNLARRGPRAQIAQELMAHQRVAGGAMADMDIAFRGDIHTELAAVRVFPKPDYRAGFSGTRSDFRDTVHWEPTVTTGAKGTAQVRFYLSDAVTTFRITAEGVGGGAAGHSEQTLTSVLPVSIATKLPPAVSVGDRLALPLMVSSTRDQSMKVDVAATFDSGLLTVAKGSKAQDTISLAGRSDQTVWVPVEVGSGRERATVRLSAKGGGMSDAVVRELQVVPPGFPQTWSVAGEGEIGRTQRFTVELQDVVPDSLVASVTWHPSSVSNLLTGMEGMIRTPGGCFEQTSSTNWPNVAILKYLDAHDGDPKLKMKSAQALNAGYAKLTGYQVDAGGFETWGTGPGKEALSAFGLLQFKDMDAVYDVDSEILSKDVDYLLSQRDGKGGFKKSGESAHGYGAAPEAVLNGFITYALAETGHTDRIAPELKRQAEVAQTSDDPYVLALAARTLLLAQHPAGKTAVSRLAKMQAEDGSFPGAESSITRSYEANLLVESTALAALALMKAGDRGRADKAVSWLIDNRQGVGTWGATQATALALAALTEHAEMNKVPRTGGAVSIAVNGKNIGSLNYAAEQAEPLLIDGWETALKPGKNTIELTQISGEPLPFAVDVNWMSTLPATSPGAELGLRTSLSSDAVAMGSTVRMTATINNKLDRIVPSPIARLGLPAGLEAQTWQLEQMQDRGEIAFFETRDREVTLYWDGIKPDQVHQVKLDLVATVPGHFIAPASSAYPYYNDDEKAWAEGGVVDVAVP